MARFRPEAGRQIAPCPRPSEHCGNSEALLGQQIVNGLMLGSVYAMVAVALTLSHRRAQLPQFQHSRHVHDRRHGDLGASSMPACPGRCAVVAALDRGRHRLADRRALHLALDARGRAFRPAGLLDGISDAVRASGDRALRLGPAHGECRLQPGRYPHRRPRHRRSATDRSRLLDRADLGIVDCC